MFACLDVDYRGALGPAVAGCSLFSSWTDAAASRDLVAVVPTVADYEPGHFYKRELPCLITVLGIAPAIDVAVIDGHVWLDTNGTKGLGAYLYDHRGGAMAVIGVAKNRYGDGAVEVLRGASATPLYVTSIGIDITVAKRHVLEMAGEHRIPTLLKHVDRLCRDATL